MEALALKTAGELALQGAGWAVAILLGFAVVLLYRDALKDKAAILVAVGDIKAAIQASTDASRATAMAIEGLKAMLETRGHAVEGLSRQVEALSKDVEHHAERIRERQSEILLRVGARP